MLADFSYIHERLFSAIASACDCGPSLATGLFGITSPVAAQIARLSHEHRKHFATSPPPGVVTFRIPDNMWNAVLNGDQQMAAMIGPGPAASVDSLEQVKALNIDAVRTTRELLARDMAFGCCAFRISKVDGAALVRAPLHRIGEALQSLPCSLFTVVGSQDEALWARIAQAPPDLATAIPVIANRKR